MLRTRTARIPTLWMPILAGVAVCGGCLLGTGPEVVVYTALDEQFSRPIFARFHDQTGITVRGKFDTESTKTVGLVEAILAERERPRCDLFWNNEILHTLRLQKAGLLRAYYPPGADAFPAQYRSPGGTWYGFAARARVLVVNTERLPESEWPKSILDLADLKWRGRAAIAKPLFGTTATHAACLYETWGRERAGDFFRDVKENVQVLAGNKQVALAVAAGRADFGLTDTDDAIVELEKGMPVAIVYPDQGEDQMGTLFIPNTLAIIRGGPHPEAARRLADFLLSPEVEKWLAEGPSAQIPLRPHIEAEVRVETPATVRAMEVDFEAAADVWETAASELREIFARSD